MPGGIIPGGPAGIIPKERNSKLIMRFNVEVKTFDRNSYLDAYRAVEPRARLLFQREPYVIEKDLLRLSRVLAILGLGHLKY